MFRDMRRSKQLMTQEDSLAVLERCTSGTLALIGDDDYTYSLPTSYAYLDGKIYFHSAAEGHKNDAIKKHDKVSFSIIDRDDIVQAEYTTYFRSVVVFGKIKVTEDIEEKKKGLVAIIEKYSPDFTINDDNELMKQVNSVTIIELSVEHITGKEAIELVTARENN